MKKVLLLGLGMFLASNVFGALPPEQWDKMRRSGYSSEAIDKFIKLDKSAAAGITLGGRGLGTNELDLEVMNKTNLVSQIKIIGNGVWFTVSWKSYVNPPPKVVVIDPNRLILSEGVYKKTRNGLCYYRVPESSVPVASSVALFAVPKMRLAELAYHPNFLKKQRARVKELAIKDDPRIGRITKIQNMQDGTNKAFCKWSIKSFAAKPFSTLAIFDRELNFIRACVIEHATESPAGFKLTDMYGTILSTQVGDYVIPLSVAKKLGISQGKLLFQKPESPLKIVNIFGTPTFSTKTPSISHSFPEMLFPGLYRFGVTRGSKDKIPCTQFTEILIQSDITGMVDFTELKEKTPEDNGRYRERQSPEDDTIHLLVKRFAVRYFQH